MLREFGPEIWLADGPDVSVAGFHYPTRMAVMRLAGGELVLWSPIAVQDELRAEIDALGQVRDLVAPNSLHHLFLGAWKEAYPKALLYAPPGLRTKRPDLAFDRDIGAERGSDWGDEIDHVPITGNLITTEIAFFHHRSGTALFADLLQQIPQDRVSGWRAWVAKLDLMVGPEPSVPRKFRLAFTNRRAARDALSRIFAWPVRQVVMAHGTPVTSDASSFLRRAFRWLGA